MKFFFKYLLLCFLCLQILILDTVFAAPNKFINSNVNGGEINKNGSLKYFSGNLSSDESINGNQHGSFNVSITSTSKLNATNPSSSTTKPTKSSSFPWWATLIIVIVCVFANLCLCICIIFCWLYVVSHRRLRDLFSW